MSHEISIVMAVYNGEKYLSEQIKSILGQSYRGWQLLIRDDGSTDSSVDIINEYVQRYPYNIRLIADRNGNIGISQNFLRILGYADTDYVMFCDQDDIWLPNKIEVTFNKMKEIEDKFSEDIPVLIHTDLKVVDRNLGILSDSFWKFQNLRLSEWRSLNRLLVQNVVTGCTMMINRALKEKIRSLPKQTIAYDWWISLVAAAFGKIDYVPAATVLYRQHDDNDTGGKEWGLRYIISEARQGKGHLKNILHKTQQQAAAFLDVFRDELADKYIDLLSVYSTLNQQSFFVRRLNLIKYKFFKIGFLRNVGLFLAV